MVLRTCTATIRYVAERSTWATVLLWLVLWPLLLPAWIVVRTGGSRGGKATAGAVALGVLVAGILPAELPPGDGAASSVATAPAATGSPAAVPSPTPSPASSPSPQPSPSPRASPTASPTLAETPSPGERATAAGASPRGDDAPVVLTGRVVGIVDGDTLDLADGTRVRLAIADTPEVHGGQEACGPEASRFSASYVAGVTVAIYRPTSAPSTDPYGRLLGEVVRVTDGGSLNVALVAAGLATIDRRFTAEDPDLTRRLEIAAEQAPTPACADTAGGEPTYEPTSDTSQGQVAPPPSSGTSGDPGSFGGRSCHAAYEPCVPPPAEVGDLDCPDIRARYSNGVTVDLAVGDPHRLDGDRDGRGCE